MKKWLDNYNDSNVTIPQGFVGEGYNTKGRNFSPSWGGQFQNGGNVLSGPTIYGSTDRETGQIIDFLANKNIGSIDDQWHPNLFNVDFYNKLWEQYKDAGSPQIRNLTDENSHYVGMQKGRAFYIPGRKQMHIKPTIDDYYAELSHAIQEKKGTLKNDYLKYPTREEYDKYAYNDSTAGEYNAHKVIQPELKKGYNNQMLLSNSDVVKIAEEPYEYENSLPLIDQERISKARTRNFKDQNNIEYYNGGEIMNVASPQNPIAQNGVGIPYGQNPWQQGMNQYQTTINHNKFVDKEKIKNYAQRNAAIEEQRIRENSPEDYQSPILQNIQEQNQYQQESSDIYIDPQTGKQVIQNIGIQPSASPIDAAVLGVGALYSGGMSLLGSMAELANPLPNIKDIKNILKYNKLKLAIDDLPKSYTEIKELKAIKDRIKNASFNDVIDYKKSRMLAKKAPDYTNTFDDYEQLLEKGSNKVIAKNNATSSNMVWDKSDIPGIQRVYEDEINTGYRNFDAGHPTNLQYINRIKNPKITTVDDLMRSNANSEEIKLGLKQGDEEVSPFTLGTVRNHELDHYISYPTIEDNTVYNKVFNLDNSHSYYTGNRLDYLDSPPTEFNIGEFYENAPYIDKKGTEIKARLGQLKDLLGKRGIEQTTMPELNAALHVANNPEKYGMFNNMMDNAIIGSKEINFFRRLKDKKGLLNYMNDVTKNPNLTPFGITPIAIGAGASQLKNETQDKPSYASGGIIKDNNGYWNPDNWGKPVEIDSNNITMKGVHQNLMGISDTGDTQMMYPNQEYHFKGKKVTEYPIALNGISQQNDTNGKQLKQLTDFSNSNNWLQKYM